MTRVNAHMKPHILSDQHLVAEHREIVRLAKLGKFSQNKTENTRCSLRHEIICVLIVGKKVSTRSQFF